MASLHVAKLTVKKELHKLEYGSCYTKMVLIHVASEKR